MTATGSPAPVSHAAQVARPSLRPPRDAFPHTRRPLPWILAAFVGIVLLVPVDATTVKVHLPVNSDLDRFLVVLVVFLWLLLRGDQPSAWRSRRSKLYVTAVALFWAVLLAGVLAGSGRIVRLDEWTLSEKQVLLVGSFFAVGWFALTALRPQDLGGFHTYMIALGTIFAIGIVVEARTGYNAFYSISRSLLVPIAHVAPAPTQLNGNLTGDGRVVVVGSTGHGLAAVSVLAAIMGFALIRIFDAPSLRSWLLHALLFGLMAAAAMATQKKTAVIVILAVVVFVGCFRPRKFIKLLPLGLVLIGFIHAVAPGNIGTVLDPTRWFDSSSSAHRSNDLRTLWPDVASHPLLGRGYGSVDVDHPDQFRILDNQYLGILWQTGVLGLASYMWMILAPIVGARRAWRDRDPTVARAAIAASAGCVGFFVVNALFDALTYSQAPYMFFTVAAFCVVASGATARPAPGRAHAVRVREPVPG